MLVCCRFPASQVTTELTGRVATNLENSCVCGRRRRLRLPVGKCGCLVTQVWLSLLESESYCSQSVAVLPCKYLCELLRYVAGEQVPKTNFFRMV